MPLFAAYDSITGKIDRVTTSQMPTRHGEQFLPIESADSTLAYVKNGMLKNYPSRPSDWAEFDFVTETWTDPRTADEIYDEAQACIRAFHDAVNTKRLQIISDGTDVYVTGHGKVALQGRPEDQTSLQGLAFGAQLRLSVGDNTAPMEFLDRENVLHQLFPMQMLELWQKGAAFISAIYAQSWAIKEMNPTTTNPNDPALWALD